MPPSLSPQDFVAKWRQVSVKERSGYQEHFRDVCALIGHPSPTDDDPTGTRYAFEAGADKQRGGQGGADAGVPGILAGDYAPQAPRQRALAPWNPARGFAPSIPLCEAGRTVNARCHGRTQVREEPY